MQHRIELFLSLLGAVTCMLGAAYVTRTLHPFTQNTEALWPLPGFYLVLLVLY